MKRLLFAGLLLMGVSSVAVAQEDDIYATGSDNRRAAQVDGSGRGSNNDVYQQERFDDSRQQRNNFNRGGDGTSNDAYNSYDNPDDYIDNDELSYSSRINRFNYSFYNLGYYNVFYNPFWYDRFWYDPYMGWNPWRPHFGLSFGIGPCWTSYWGYSSWYGYSAWGSYWGYPSYGCGWGNYFGCNYWNRYYSARDYNYNSSFSNHYGPRQVGNAGFTQTGRPSGSGLRQANPGYNGGSTRPMAFNNQQVQQNGNIGRGNNGINNVASGRPQYQGAARGGNGQVQQQGGFSRGINRIFGGGARGDNNVARGNNGNAGARGNSNAGNGVRSFFGGGGNRGGNMNFGGGNHNSGGGAVRGGGGGGRSGGGGGHTGGGHSGRR